MANDYFKNYIESVNKTSGSNNEKNVNIINNHKTTPVFSKNRDTFDLAINNGNVIVPGEGVFRLNIGIKNGKIAILSDTVLNADKVIDANNKYVSPGLIDPHVHLGIFAPLEEELQIETKAAIAGGVTTVGCYFATKDSHFESFPEIQNQINKFSSVDIIPHLVINNDIQKKEIVNYVDQLKVASFKLYMNGVPGIMPDVDDAFIVDVLSQIGKVDKKCIVCVHTENRDLVRRATEIVKNEHTILTELKDWSDTHPDMAEEEAAIRISYLAKKMGVDIYLVHISTAATIKSLREIKKDNKHVKVETTSPYLSIDYNSTKSYAIKMEPPIRSMDDIEELWNAVVEGTIDTIGTDNVTITKDEKNLSSNNIWDVMPGYPATETHLSVLLNEGVIKRKIPIELVIEKLTKNPAKTFGVYPQKGSMIIGSDADIVIIDMELTKEVNADQLFSRSDFSIYDSWELTGWPVTTIKSGKIVYLDGKFTGEISIGSCLQR